MPTARFNLLSRIAMLALGGFASLVLAQAGPRPDHLEPASAEAIATDAVLFREHNVTLANPFFEGRAPGTRGNELAADYIESKFRAFGLLPAFADESGTPNSTYKQPFRHGTVVKATVEAARYSVDGTDSILTPRRDFNVLGFSGAGKVTGKLVFVGYSLPASDPNSYQSYPDGVDLAGKIAVLFRFEPMDAEGKSTLVKNGWSPRAALEPKIAEAVERGAAAVILVNPPGAFDERTNKLDDAMGTRPRGNDGQPVPVVMLSLDAAEKLVKAADVEGRSLLDLRNLADNGVAIIDLPKASVTIDAAVERSPVTTNNVAAILPGVGELKDQYLIIGAHYDHVGYGYFGSNDPQGRGQIHPGADDNASGTSAMLVLAQKLSASQAEMPPDEPRRSIMFMGFSAEEAGLIGSAFYCKHPIVPIEKHALMINLDMVGRMSEQPVEISGVGTGEGLKDFVTPYFDASGLKIASKPGGLGPSDHASFYRAGVPVLFAFTGFHPQYHKPADVSSLINNEGAAQLVDLFDRIATDFVVRPEAFAYQGEKKPEAGADHAQGTGVGEVRNRVRFGIMPGDYSGSEPGVLVGEVFPTTPAAEAGLKEGDLIVSWNGKKVESVEAWMPLLETAKPGDVVEIKYLRKVGDKVQEFMTKCTLTARAPRNQ